jgi:hypothetical protein
MGSLIEQGQHRPLDQGGTAEESGRAVGKESPESATETRPQQAWVSFQEKQSNRAP